MKKIALLGSTGSIGKQVLEIVDMYPDKYKIVSLAANSNFAELERQMSVYKPEIATLSDVDAAKKITKIPKGVTFYYGENALYHSIECDADLIFVAVMGFSGLSVTLEALKKGKTVALANKESLVAGGELCMSTAKKYGAKIIPVDSEHSAIWQALSFDTSKPFKSLIITASGGAFRDYDIKDLPFVTAKDALRHPNWKMGDKITIDCATMANKAFEVAEAKWLFNTTLDKIQTVLHRESIIHSMVLFEDGAIMAQLSSPDMKIPISLALSGEKRMPLNVKPLDFTNLQLTFAPIDYQKYPCFPLIIKAIESGGIYPLTASAANEVAVKLFLEGKISYPKIHDIIAFTLNNIKGEASCFESLKAADLSARYLAISYYKSLS